MGSDANSMANLNITNMGDKINLNISDIRMVGSDIRTTASTDL
jgi:hypothetical protein